MLEQLRPAAQVVDWVESRYNQILLPAHDAAGASGAGQEAPGATDVTVAVHFRLGSAGDVLVHARHAERGKERAERGRERETAREDYGARDRTSERASP